MTNRPKTPAKEDRSETPITSLRDLEYRLGEDRETLRLLAKNWRTEYSPFQQTKPAKPFQREVKTGKVRNIDNPSKELKRIQKKILNRLLRPVKLPHFLFGAVSKCSVNAHAAEHLLHGSECVVKLDVKSYYPNVTNRHVYFVWEQMLHCSPASIYGPVLDECSEKNITATAWVDDLIFSGEEARSVMKLARQALAANGFKLSSKKRVIMNGHDSKVITGVRLGNRRIRAPKEKLSDIRAAIHKLEIGQIADCQRDKYIASLNGRIKNIEQICALDARPLKQRLVSALPLSGA